MATGKCPMEAEWWDGVCGQGYPPARPHKLIRSPKKPLRIAGELAQWAKGLPYKHEDLSSHLQSPHKSWDQRYTLVPPTLGDRGRGS